MSVLLLALAIVAAPPALPPTGFSAAELARRSAARNAPEVRAALRRSLAVRAALVLNPPAAGDLLDASEAGALRGAFGALEGDNAPYVSFFMRGAVTRIAPSRFAMVAGYYNPLLDIWLIAPLQRVGGEWRITQARLVDGALLRGGGGLWHQDALNPFLALTASYRQAVGGFDRRFRSRPDLPAGGDAFAMLAARTRDWIGSLASWRQDRASADRAEALRTAIVEGRLAREPLAEASDAARQIDALPSDIRRSMAIVGAARRGEVTSLFIASPMAPELLLVLDLSADRRPQRIGIVNLANAALES